MYDVKAYEKACRRVVPEGLVLLENDGALPLSDSDRVALFSRGQFEYVKSGTGSGGRVNTPYVKNIHDELCSRLHVDSEVSEFYKEFIKQNPFVAGDGWLAEPSQKEPILPTELVLAAAGRCNKAIFVLCRTAGEGKDAALTRGDWYLSFEEEDAIEKLSDAFEHVIVLINGGNLMDLTWIKKYNIGTVMYIWQGGQEGAAGTVDALMGDAAPSGRLADTVAISYADYPVADCFGDEVRNIHKEDIYVGYRYFETFAKDKVLYPFGYGLGYTSFDTETVRAERDGGLVKLLVKVKNTGRASGKEVVQVYFGAPNGKLGKPARELVAFKKTALLKPGETEDVYFEIDINEMASYDDSGVTPYPYSYVLEAGEYALYVGENVRAAKKALVFEIESDTLVRACTQALAPIANFEKMTTKDGKTAVFEPAALAKYDFAERVLSNLPEPSLQREGNGVTLYDVADGKSTLDEFVSQLSVDEMMQLCRGEGFSSIKASVIGTASVFGGLSRKLYEMGIPAINTCDGPGGLRMESLMLATCIPSGSLLSAAFDPEVISEVIDGFADELVHYDVDVILGPGINIHRSPLCGRNFEYYSEDPRLTGSIAAKFCERFTKKGVFATLKHFAVNSQETERVSEDEVLSERALREIYLKGFEMAVREGNVRCIMTSYNRINGRSASSQYDLCTTILRGEWGYDGIVMTDWWPKVDSHDKTSFRHTNVAEIIKAQNDVYMVVDDAVTHKDNMPAAYESGLLTLGELQRSVKNLLSFIMQTLGFKTKRASVLDSLSSVGDPVLSIGEEGLEKRLSGASDYVSYDGGPHCTAELSLEEEGYYCLELFYAIPADITAQNKMRVALNDRDVALLILPGTNGEIKAQKTRMYLAKDNCIVFEKDYVKRINIYKIEEK